MLLDIIKKDLRYLISELLVQVTGVKFALLLEPTTNYHLILMPEMVGRF